MDVIPPNMDSLIGYFSFPPNMDVIQESQGWWDILIRLSGDFFLAQMDREKPHQKTLDSTFCFSNRSTVDLGLF